MPLARRVVLEERGQVVGGVRLHLARQPRLREREARLPVQPQGEERQELAAHHAEILAAEPVAVLHRRPQRRQVDELLAR